MSEPHLLVPSAPLTEPRVLLVDDEPALCRTLAAYLEDEGMQPHSAGSGEEALALVDAGLVVDVCVLDMRLPGIDGNQLALQLHRRLPSARYLIHTGSSCYSLPQTLRQIGITERDVFCKPQADLSRLAEAVRRLCHG